MSAYIALMTGLAIAVVEPSRITIIEEQVDIDDLQR